MAQLEQNTNGSINRSMLVLRLNSRYKQNQEQQTVTPSELNLLTKAYEILDQDDLTESALFAYLQKVTDYLERSFVALQNKTSSENCYESS